MAGHSVMMESETLSPIAEPAKPRPPAPKGRLADLIAAGVSALSAVLACFTAVVFFAGFALNDTELGGLVSAFVFSALLGAFAIIPSIIIALIAARGYKYGLTRRAALWCVFLALPWVTLSLTVLIKTPLPAYMAAIALCLSSLMCLWALISVILSPSRNDDAT